MKNIGLQLNPLTKLKIYTRAKKVILQKMDHDAITPEKAQELIDYFKNGLPEIQTAEEGQRFYMDAATMFPEIKDLPSYFEHEEEEKFDEVVMEIAGKMMEEVDVYGASKLIEQLQNSDEKEEKIRLLDQLEKDYPEVFSRAVEACLQT